MNRKILLLLAVLVGLSSTGEAYVNPPSEPACSPVIFYAGMVGGIERMTGRRAESLTETIAGVPTVTTYGVDQRMLENNGNLSFVGGFLFGPPAESMRIGPEFFFGRGNALSNVSDARQTPDGLNNRFYSTDFQRKFFYGGLIRVGYLFCEKYFPSLSFGIDRSQFRTKRILALDPGPNRQATVIDRTKGFNGFLFGIGFERHFKHLILGVDLKLIQYRRQSNDDSVVIANSPAASRLSVRPVMYTAGLRLCYRF